MRLEEGIVALGLHLPQGAAERLSAFLALLVKWNRTYNLTAIRDPQEMITHHLLDSLAALPVLESEPWAQIAEQDGQADAAKMSALAARRSVTLADVGSGAGLPGLVLAIAHPDWSITSIEAVEKKAAFQRQARIELGLDNVRIVCGRVEDVGETFAAVISRAFASLADFVGYAGHLSPCLLAMKGVYPADEVARIPAGWQLKAADELHVPGLAAHRHLLRLERT